MPSHTRLPLRRSVRGRLIMLVGAIAAPALVLAAALVYQAFRNEKRAITEQLSATARAVSFLTDSHIAECEALLRGLASSRALAERDWPTVHERARTIARGFGSWIVLSNLEGDQVIDTRVPVGTSLPKFAADDEFREALARGKTYISNVVTAPSGAGPAVFFSVPITTPGHPLLALSLVMEAGTFGASLRLDQIAPSNVISIADRAGTIVTRSRSPELYVGSKAMPDMVAAISQNPTGVGSSVTLEGIPVVTAFNRARLSQWTAMIGAPKAQLYASTRQLLWLGLPLSFGLLLIAAIMAYWIIQGVARGVESLVFGTQALARGANITWPRSGLAEMDFVADEMLKTTRQLHDTKERLEAALAQEQLARSEAEALSATAQALTAELDLQSAVQKATDAATKLTGANFGAFFYNLVDQQQESYVLYTLSGLSRESFEKVGLPRNTAVFASTFRGEGVVRVGDITADPRYGKNLPHAGVPSGHVAVRSYLAIPVVSRTGEVLGGMFFGHPEPNVFTERSERIAVGIAAQASIAVDNAKLYQSSRAAVERLNFSMSSLQLGEWEWNPVTDAMRISPRAAEIFGVSADQKYTREEIRAALHPDDRDRARTAATEAARSGQDYGIEYRVLHPQSGPRWVAATGRPIFNADGKLTAMMGVVQDITDRKSAEIVLRTQNEVLEQRVLERTHKLRETIGELEAFSYSISHDMRAPLRSMQGYADLLLRDHGARLDAVAQRYLARIDANSRRLELLVRDVLAYSRVAKEEVELKSVDLDNFLPSLVQQMPEFHLPGVTISVQRPLPRVLAHEAYLSQIFSNLVGNAVKFVAPGASAQVDITAEEAGRLVKFAVRDNGIGIHPEHFDRIFQIFGRVHADKTFEGTGIGLAIVKKAVHRMGGSIGVESALGEGTTFWFTLAKA